MIILTALNFFLSPLFLYVLSFWIYNDSGIQKLIDLFFFIFYIIFDLHCLIEFFGNPTTILIPYLIKIATSKPTLKPKHPEVRIVKKDKQVTSKPLKKIQKEYARKLYAKPAFTRLG